MERFIRTKNGKIIDTTKFENVYYNELGYLILESEDTNYCINDDEIINQADTIEELTEFGDLVGLRFLSTISNQFVVKFPNGERAIGNYAFDYAMSKAVELYTKQGNDYILVAKKEKGEWRVI